MACQIWVVVGVAREAGLPFAVEGLELGAVGAGFADGFVVVEDRVGGADDSLAEFEELEAIVDVVVVEGEFFGEAGDFQVVFGAGHHTGAGDGGPVSDDLGAVEISGVVGGLAVEGVAGVAVEKNHAGVLLGVVWEEEFCADSADVGLL